MKLLIRSYRSRDYAEITTLYKQSDLYGGQFDEDRDSKERLQKRIEADPDAILVAEQDGKIVGTLSVIEDFRVAWLFRFAVVDGNEEKENIEKALLVKAEELLQQKGHRQVLIYSPVGYEELKKRYERLGFIKGTDYACYWKKI